MEYLTQGASGYFYPTCKEMQELDTDKYLIKFVSISNHATRYCWVTDISDYPNRNQQFLIQETSTPTTETNQVKLDSTGFWDFIVYEYTGSAPSDETGLNEVERGRCTVQTTELTYDKYEGYQTEIKQYNG